MDEQQAAGSGERAAGPPDPYGTAELTPRDRARLRAAFWSFPGGAGSRTLTGFQHSNKDFSVDDIVKVVEELSQICSGWAEENVRLRRELDKLEQQRDEVRKFLGPLLEQAQAQAQAQGLRSEGGPASRETGSEKREAGGGQRAAGSGPRKFSVIEGTDGETLGCDCYGGCWGDHARSWPSLMFRNETDGKLAWRLCHQELEVGVPRPKEEQVGHGNYVLDRDGAIRFATRALLNAHVRRLEQVLGW